MAAVTIRRLRSRPRCLWESIHGHALAANRKENQSSASAATIPTNCSARSNFIMEECSHALCPTRQSRGMEASTSTNGLDFPVVFVAVLLAFKSPSTWAVSGTVDLLQGLFDNPVGCIVNWLTCHDLDCETVSGDGCRLQLTNRGVADHSRRISMLSRCRFQS